MYIPHPRPSVPKDPPLLCKTFPVLDAETVGPVTNSWCSATVQEASAFLCHSQLASAFRKVQSPSSKDAIH